MTNFLPQPNADGLVKLNGTVRNLKVTRASASFVFTESDQTKMGVVAFAAAIAGLGGQAMAIASNASAMEEEADHLEFELDGRQVKGWVWRNPFKEGDEVTVAAEHRADGHWEAFGVRCIPTVRVDVPDTSRTPHGGGFSGWADLTWFS